MKQMTWKVSGLKSSFSFAHSSMGPEVGKDAGGCSCLIHVVPAGSAGARGPTSRWRLCLCVWDFGVLGLRLFLHMESFFFFFASRTSLPHGVGFSQNGGLRAIALRMWQPPGHFRTTPRTGTVSLPLYCIGQNSHESCLDS